MKILKEKFNSLLELGKKNIGFNNISKELNRLLKIVKQDSELIDQLSKENKIIVFYATDTDRTITIKLGDGDIVGYIGEPEKYDLKFAALEIIHLGILCGEIDPEGAFFSRKIRIYGSILETVRFKNMYLSKIQYCFRKVINAA